MQYKIDENLRDFKAWAGGYDTLATLVEKDLVDEAEEFLEELLEEPTATDINDVLWFERDLIAEGLGYKDWQELTESK